MGLGGVAALGGERKQKPYYQLHRETERAAEDDGGYIIVLEIGNRSNKLPGQYLGGSDGPVLLL